MEAVTSSFDDVLSKVGQIEGGFTKMPKAPGTGEAQAGVKSEMGAQKDLLKQLSEFKTSEPPKPETLPKPENQEYSNPMNAFKEVMPVFAIFASMATRHPLKTAMTAMASSMDAYHKGETEKFEIERKNAEAQTRYALDVTKQNNEYYNAVIAKESMDIGQKEALIKAHATMAEDWRVLAGLQNEGYKGAVEAIKGNNEIHAKALDAAEKIFKIGQTQNGMVNPETADFIAEQVLAGDKSGLTNFGRGAQGAANLSLIRDKVAEKSRERGMSGADLARVDAEFKGLQAEESTIGRQEGNVQMAATEAKKMSGILRQVSAKVPRSDWVPLASGEVKFKKSVGDIPAAQLDAAVNTYINVYARAINPKGGGTVSDKEHARDILMSGMGEGQMSGVLDILDQEVDAALASPGAVREKLGGKSPAITDLHEKYGLEK